MKILCVVFILFFAWPVLAQNTPSPGGATSLQTGDAPSEVSLNGHAALIAQISSFNKRSAIFGGAGLALTVNSKLFVGVYGLKMLNEVTEDVPDSMLTDLQIDFTHGGLWGGYNFTPDATIQFILSGMLGVGSITANDIDFKDRVAVFAPMAGVQIRPLDWMRIEINGGYRLMNKVNNTPLFAKRNLSAPFAGISLKFGGFD